jgi:hypothetical protein
MKNELSLGHDLQAHAPTQLVVLAWMKLRKRFLDEPHVTQRSFEHEQVVVGAKLSRFVEHRPALQLQLPSL